MSGSSKYCIEGNIDFYQELYKQLSTTTTTKNNNQTDDANLCLITNAPLTNHYVTLMCGHKFNYEPIYNDILNHKIKFNSMERNMLKTMELRCPYCRHIQKTLLPYHAGLGFKKVHGVNYCDESKVVNVYNTGNVKWKWGEGVCAYQEPVVADAVSSTQCVNTVVTHVDLIGKSFCCYHRYFAIQKYIKAKKVEEKAKVKEEKAVAKALEKANMKEQKAAQKEAEKAAKAAKAAEVVVLCKQVLHSGKNKGQSCSQKVKMQGYCLRHSKIHDVMAMGDGMIE